MSARAKFVHVFATFGAGGPQVRAVQLMRRLGAAAEHVVMAMDGNQQAQAQVPQDVVVSFAPPPPRAGLLATVRAQRRWLAAQRPDLVLTYNWGAIESALAARRAGLPLVHHEDGFLPDEARRRLRRRSWLRRWALRGVPVIVPSSGLAQIARDEWWVRNVHHLPNGVDLDRFVPRPRPARARLVLGTVGGLRPEKDHATLLRAVAKVPEIDLHLVGGGALRPQLEALAAELGLGARVQFCGPTDDTAASYCGFDVFVLSSRTEQMPLVLLEAMASGLPVIATDVGDVRAVLPPTASPFVVPAENADALAQAVRAMCLDPAVRGQQGRANRARAEADFEAGRCLDRFLAVYRASCRESAR